MAKGRKVSMKARFGAVKDIDVGYYKPPEGAVLDVKVVECRFKETKKGDPGWGLFLEVTDSASHPDAIGRKFWQNYYITGNDIGDAITMNVFRVLGVLDEFWDDDPDAETEVPAALVGGTGTCTIKYRENEQNPEQPWVDARWKFTAPTVTDDEVDDLDLG